MWNHSLINISILEYLEHFIHCHVQDLNNHKTWYAFVYANPQKEKQKLLWPDIVALKPRISEAWVLLGDFNNICNLSENLGGNQTFTWCNDHKDNSVIYERLD